MLIRSPVRSEQCIDGNIEDISAVLDSVERRRNVLWSRDLQCDDFETKRAGGGLDLSQFLFGSRIANIGHDGQSAATGENFA